MTKLEELAVIKAHLLKQNARSEDNNGSCLYRSPTGLKCAIGALIPDEKYNPKWDNYQDGDLMPLDDIKSTCGISLTVEEMIRIRDIHDGYPPSEWAERLAKLEKEFNGSL